MAVIQLRSVTVHFGPTRALSDVDLEVRRGELLSVLGPNGSGKTTLLRVVAGLLQPSDGTVLLDGTPVSRDTLHGLRQRVTMVFQRPVVFGTTVFNNVAYGLRRRGLSESEVAVQVEEALRLVGLDSLSTRHARSLSGGEQKRLSLAMALVTQPELLLLDEPTAYLDAEGADMVWRLVESLRGTGTGIVVATHDLLGMTPLSDRAVFLRAGHVVSTREAHGHVMDGLAAIDVVAPERNVYHGHARLLPGSSTGPYRALVQIAPSVTIEALAHHGGEVRVSVPPEDIALSVTPVISSARNSLHGRVVGVERHGDLAVVSVDVGVVFNTLVTAESLARLDIREGTAVYVTFKASSVRVYSAGAGTGGGDMHDQS